MTKRLLTILALFVSPLLAFAEVVVTPFGVFDPAENVKISYNVKTENGVETKSRVVSPDKVSDKKQLDALVKKMKSVKFVVSPEDAETIEDDRTFSVMMKPDAGASAASFRTRTFMRVKSLIIVETRKYYKENVPGAILPNGQFINAGGGSMVLVDKNKRPLGTLIISYSTDFVVPPIGELERAEFIVVSRIPDNWKPLPVDDYDVRRRGWNAYRLPSGEKVFAKDFGKVHHAVGWKANATVTYTFNKLKKKK